MNKKPRFRTQEDRNLFALALAVDPNMKKQVREMFRMGVRNIRADYILFSTGDRVPDPGAWAGDITPNIGIMLLRTREGGWWLNGF